MFVQLPIELLGKFDDKIPERERDHVSDRGIGDVPSNPPER
jgi:hypothetical protein